MTYMMAFLVAGIAGLTAAVGVAFYMSSRGHPGGYASAVEGRSPPPGRMPSRPPSVPGHGDETAAEYLREQVDCARTFGRYDEFEEGIESAVARWEKVMR